MKDIELGLRIALEIGLLFYVGLLIGAAL